MMTISLTKDRPLKAIITGFSLVIFLLGSLGLVSLAYAKYDDYNKDVREYNVMPAWRPELDFEPPSIGNLPDNKITISPPDQPPRDDPPPVNPPEPPEVLPDSPFKPNSALDILPPDPLSLSSKPELNNVGVLGGVTLCFGDGCLQMGDSRADALFNQEVNSFLGLDKAGKLTVDILIKALAIDIPYVRQLAQVALVKIGRPAVEPLIEALSNEDYNVRQLAQVALVKIGRPAVEPLNKASDDKNPIVSYRARRALLEIDQLASIKDYNKWDTITQEAIELMFVKQPDNLQKIMNSENDPLIRQNAQKIRSRLEERTALIKDTKDKYKVTIGGDEPFSLWELELLSSVLRALPPEFTKGTPFLKQGDVGPMALAEYNSFLKTIALSALFWPEIEPGRYEASLFHEIAHNIDHKYFDLKAFDKLYTQSTKPEDFAYDYGRTNRQEDFATVVEYYATNPSKEFLRGIKQAEAGNPVYLEKLLFVLDVFTKGHPSYTVIYEIGEYGVIKQYPLKVSRDASGKINAIAGASIKDYNGLKALFSNLRHDR